MIFFTNPWLYGDTVAVQAVELRPAPATDAGTTAGKARRVIEADLGRPVVSQQNYRALTPPQPEEPKAQADAAPSDGSDSDEPRQLPLFLDPL